MAHYTTTLVRITVMDRHWREVTELASSMKFHSRPTPIDQELSRIDILRSDERVVQDTLELAKELVSRWIPFDFKLLFPPETTCCRIYDRKYYQVKLSWGEEPKDWAGQEEQWCRVQTTKLLKGEPHG